MWFLSLLLVPTLLWITAKLASLQYSVLVSHYSGLVVYVILENYIQI